MDLSGFLSSFLATALTLKNAVSFLLSDSKLFLIKLNKFALWLPYLMLAPTKIKSKLSRSKESASSMLDKLIIDSCLMISIIFSQIFTVCPSVLE